MYTTKASRFNADSRLRYEHQLSHYSLMFLSIYIILISSAPTFDVIDWVSSNVCAFFSFILSVFVLGVAAFEAGNNRLEKAFKLHDNALKINALLRTLNDKSDATKAADEYSQILASCDHNHSEIDYYKARALNKHLDEETSLWEKILWRLHGLRHYGFYWLAITAPAVVIITLFVLHFYSS